MEVSPISNLSPSRSHSFMQIRNVETRRSIIDRGWPKIFRRTRIENTDAYRIDMEMI